MLAIHEQLTKLDLKITQMDFVATSLYLPLCGIRFQCILKQKQDLLLNHI